MYVHGTIKLIMSLIHVVLVHYEWFVVHYVNIDYGNYLAHFHFPHSSIISQDSQTNRKSEPDFHSLLEAEVNKTDQSNQL